MKSILFEFFYCSLMPYFNEASTGGIESAATHAPSGYLLSLGTCAAAAMLIGLFSMLVCAFEPNFDLSKSAPVRICNFALTFGGAVGAIGCFLAYFFGRATLFFGISIAALFIASVLIFIFTRRKNDELINNFLLICAIVSFIGAFVCFFIFLSGLRLLLSGILLALLCGWTVYVADNVSSDFRWLHYLLIPIFGGAAIALLLMFFNVDISLSIVIALIAMSAFCTFGICADVSEILSYTVHVILLITTITVTILCIDGLFLKLGLIGALIFITGIMYFLLRFNWFYMYEKHQVIGVPIVVLGAFVMLLGFISLGEGGLILSFAISSLISALLSIAPLVWALLYNKVNRYDLTVSKLTSVSMLITGIAGTSLFAIMSAVFFAVKFIIV